MSIETVEVESIHGALGHQRMIFYKAQDHLGVWHNYGPMITSDDEFDMNGFKTVVEGKIEERLAAQEFEDLIRE